MNIVFSKPHQQQNRNIFIIEFITMVYSFEIPILLVSIYLSSSVIVCLFIYSCLIYIMVPIFKHVLQPLSDLLHLIDHKTKNTK